MKKLFLLLCLLLATSVNAAEIKFLWDASPSPGVTGYKLYVDEQQPVDVGNVLEWSTTLSDGVAHKVYATAYDDAGNESSPSNTVNVYVPHPPANLKFTITIQLEVGG